MGKCCLSRAPAITTLLPKLEQCNQHSPKKYFRDKKKIVNRVLGSE
jgi:hypothetical protein